MLPHPQTSSWCQWPCSQPLSSISRPPGCPVGASAQPDSPELVIGSTCPNLVLTCAPHLGGPLPGQHGAVLGTSSHSISPHSLQPSCPQNTSPVGSPPLPASPNPTALDGPHRPFQCPFPTFTEWPAGPSEGLDLSPLTPINTQLDPCRSQEAFWDRTGEGSGTSPREGTEGGVRPPRCPHSSSFLIHSAWLAFCRAGTEGARGLGSRLCPSSTYDPSCESARIKIARHGLCDKVPTGIPLGSRSEACRHVWECILFSRCQWEKVLYNTWH